MYRHCYNTLFFLFLKLLSLRAFDRLTKLCAFRLANTVAATPSNSLALLFILNSVVLQSVVSLYFADRYTIEYEINLCKFGSTQVLASVRRCKSNVHILTGEAVVGLVSKQRQFFSRELFKQRVLKTLLWLWFNSIWWLKSNTDLWTECLCCWWFWCRPVLHSHTPIALMDWLVESKLKPIQFACYRKRVSWDAASCLVSAHLAGQKQLKLPFN